MPGSQAERHLPAWLEATRTLDRGNQANPIEVLRREVLAGRLGVLHLDLLLPWDTGGAFQVVQRLTEVALHERSMTPLLRNG